MPLDAQSGPKHGRFRNTVTAQPFPLKPTDAFAFGVQRAQLKYNYGTTMADLATEANRVRTASRLARFGIAQDYRHTRGSLDADAIDRGMVGASASIVNQEQAYADRTAMMAANRYDRDQALIDINTQRLRAAQALEMGMKNIYGGKAALQQEMALGAYGSGGSNPWGFGPGGGPSRLKKAGAY